VVAREWIGATSLLERTNRELRRTFRLASLSEARSGLRSLSISRSNDFIFLISRRSNLFSSRKNCWERREERQKEKIMLRRLGLAFLLVIALVGSMVLTTGNSYATSGNCINGGTSLAQAPIRNNSGRQIADVTLCKISTTSWYAVISVYCSVGNAVTGTAEAQDSNGQQKHNIWSNFCGLRAAPILTTSTDRVRAIGSVDAFPQAFTNFFS